MTAERSLSTILFTDIVSSTERAAELGDERWRDLLDRHHALVRRWLRRYSGHEVKTAGDGFLVTFDSPAMALACADAIRNAIGELGLGVRCGLHIGEIERKDGDVGGLAVHIGARVADLAGAGEVYVSSTVRDAEVGSGFRFEDRGRHELRGVPGEWRVHALTGVPEEMRAALLEVAAGAEGQPGRWSRLETAKLLRVGLGYAVASAVALLGTDLLIDRWGLPGWAMPAAIVLLAIGLVVLAATAWKQADPRTSIRTAAGELPPARALDVGGVAAAIRRGELPHLTWGRAVAGGILAFALLFGFAGLWVVIQDRGRSFSPAEAIAEDAAPGLAVLPFSVQGADLEVWREGMVDLLSTNLDGAAGLRSIDSRTVLARWGEAIPAGRTADLASALDVGRRAGARYVLLGSAVSLGSGVRLSAEIYDVESAEKLGQAQVVGAQDSVFQLVDGLSIDVLRAILQGQGREGDLPNVNLSRVTTTSLPALKAYLEGEALFRRGEFDAAVPLYERAVEADSTFALALYRLGLTYGWAESVVSELAGEATERAARYAERLPEREAVLVRAERALTDGTLDGFEPLEEAVRRYPDDLEAWYLLGETYFHLGDQALVPRSRAEEAFARAVELDPHFLPAYIHRVDEAFLNADSARALSLIDSMSPIDSDRGRATLQAMYGLAFGDSVAREAAWRSIDTLDLNLVSWGLQDFRHPRFRDVEAGLYELARRNDEPDRRATPTVLLSFNEWDRGRVSDALALIDDPFFPPPVRPASLYMNWRGGLPVPEERLERTLAVEAITTGDPLARGVGLFFAGAYAADRGREADRARARGGLRDLAARLRVEGDSTTARAVDGAGLALDGLLAWSRGDRQVAADFLEEARREATGHQGMGAVNTAIRVKLGELMAEQGRLVEAERYFASLADWHASLAYRRLGDLYVEMEEFEKAREAYGLFLTAWRDHDPAVEPIVVEVRQKLAAIEPLRIE